MLLEHLNFVPTYEFEHPTSICSEWVTEPTSAISNTPIEYIGTYSSAAVMWEVRNN